MFKSIPQALILAMCAAAPVAQYGATRSPEEAQKVAADFFLKENIGRLADKDALSLAHVVNNGSLNPVSYVFNAKDGKGFVIVSAETEAIPVIGYSDTNIWDENAIPGITETLLSESVFDKYVSTRRSTRAEEGEKLLQTPEWSQEAPFNNNIPNRRLTGCVGVAVAEIMKYHNTPAQRPASLVKDGESSAYEWDTMLTGNYRSGYSMEQANAVATLVADAAIGIGTDFGMSSSSAFEVKVPYALTSMFGYDAGVSYKKLSEISQNEWVEILINEVNEDRPVLFSGQDVSAGHAFVCDGYKTDASGSTMLHFNWGWGGSANGYFAPGALNPVVSKKHSYNNLQTIVYNIKPATNALAWSPIHLTNDENQPGLTLDVTDISAVPSFTVRAGALKNISNTDFSGKLSIALFDAQGKQKTLLNDGRNFSLIALQTSKYVDFSGKLPAGVTVAADDVVRLVTQAVNEDAWLPVAGDLLVMGEARAKDGSLPYFAINQPANTSNYTVSYEAAQVVKGRDYTFKVVNENSGINVITVKANGTILTADANDNYKITNVLADQNITVVVQNKADVVSKRVLWMEAGNLKNLLDENETSSVEDLTICGTMNAEDFAFIRERMKVKRLDISKATITASGSNPANAIPAKAFQGYRSLEAIYLPTNLAILKNACLSQTNISSIEIPASVATIEYNIFVGCNRLNEVISRRANPAWINWCVFNGTPKNKLVVPVGASGTYKSKEYWQDFKDIVEDEFKAPSTFKVTLADSKDVNISSISWKMEFPVPDPNWGIYAETYEFRVETAPNIGDAIMEVYANSTLLYPRADGSYAHTVNSNTVIHVELRQPEPTTPDTSWKLTGAGGGLGLATSVVNVPQNQNFTVRANAIKVPSGADANKFFGMVLTDKDGAIKEFISTIYTSTAMTVGNQTMDFSCKVSKATVKEGNEIRLATSYNKKVWNLVSADADSITDRIKAVGNPVVYHTVTMPQTIDGAKIEGAASEVVRGMPFNLKVTPISPTQRATVAVNGVNKAVNAAIANISIPAVKEDLEIAIQINEAGAQDYVVVNVSEGTLAAKIAECPDRLKLIGSIYAWEFESFRANAGKIIDLDLHDVTIKGAMMTGNAIPENAFAPTVATGTSALRTIILPKNLERISNNAFARCLALTEISIPAGVNYVGTGAFSQCVALTRIVMEGTNPPLTGNMTPFPSNTSNLVLEVPAGYEFEYSNATFWNTLSIYKEEEPKNYYWLKFDPSRISVWYAYGHDLNHIGVGISENSPAQQVWLYLPNYQQSYRGEHPQLRLGVPFRLYDNGFDVVSDLVKGTKPPYPKAECPYPFTDVINSYQQDGGNIKMMWMPNQPDNRFYKPQNHELELVFYYPITFNFSEEAQGTTHQFVNLKSDEEWKDVEIKWFDYKSSDTKTVYREARDIQFKLNTPANHILVEPTVMVKHRIMVQSGKNPQYEEKEFEITPDIAGIYTIPQLPGDTWVTVSGELYRHVEIEEGDAVKADDLTALEDDQVSDFTDLAVTGEVTEEEFQAIREKFESLENLDLTGIENEVLPENALAGLENLRSVVLPANVTELGAGAFQNCSNLESVIIPGVSTIGEGAFDGCNSLTSIIIPAADNQGEATRSGEGAGITADSFKGLNPNCLIYLGSNTIPDAEHLNIIISENGHRVAASDIILDSQYPFNAPTGFTLGSHTISYTAHIPGSYAADIDGGWAGLMLPFTPTSWKYGVEFGEREGSGLKIVSFVSADGEEPETMTPAVALEAYKPYMAHVMAPFESVPVTFIAASTRSEGDEAVEDIKVSPNPEDLFVRGKFFTLYGSLDGETIIGECLALNEENSKFVASPDAQIGAFSAYLCPNEGTATKEFAIGEHAVWVQEPHGAGISGTNLYRGDKIELATVTKNAVIYYTTDGTDPSDAEGSRKIYSAPFDLEGEEMVVNAVAERKDYKSDVVALDFRLKKVDINYNLAHNWNWISHNMENEVAVADFATDGISRIVSQTQEVIRDPKLGLAGNLQTLLPATAYKVCVAPENGTAANITGVAFNPNATVKLQKGWNWIGCPVDDASLRISDLLANLEAEEGDMIVGLDGFEQFDTDSIWAGTLGSLVAAEGYMYFSNSDKEFSYNLVPAQAPAAKVAATRTLEDTPWIVDNHRYPSVMPLTATLLDADGMDANPADYHVAAFCGNECRGIGVNVNGVVMINIHGNNGDNIVIRYIDSANNEYVTSTGITFNEMPLGTIADPFTITLDIVSSVDSIMAGGLEIVSENGSLVVKGDLGEDTVAEIYDLAGNRLAASAAANGTVSIKGLEPGVRLIVIRTASTTLYRKVMVK